MSFDKSYPNRKDWRRPYRRGGARVTKSCRPHGGCPICRDNRLYRWLKLLDASARELKAWHAQTTPGTVANPEADEE